MKRWYVKIPILATANVWTIEAETEDEAIDLAWQHVEEFRDGTTYTMTITEILPTGSIWEADATDITELQS